ncbi:4-(cytidine 5'-diphospho)-2-C-methyl-D-erythritol kinase [Crocinitomix catalasitica]|uniref:4-(cytidine 5'-diphospho)-2-C-methyl-D-erythritol kinase n=1 Tax=Crocinitomix catalasitica TaxID=184607 RepID=UPI0004825FFC|nr:4-(cytidine 5'-diphospho)-2-C-methyl-D-erythritol kinase [Crocinitomix catalasitica]
MVVYPKTKINIGLNIIGKRLDGYHNLSSVFYPTDLSDILEIVKSDSFSYSSTGVEIDCSPENNLIIRAYNLMKSKYGLSPVKIHLHKIVPTGAGLGGGSADASATLCLLNKLFELNLSDTILKQISLELGSDCPFFIMNSPHLITGIGEVMSPINLNLSNYFIKIVHPNIHISTANAFSKIENFSSALDEEQFIKGSIQDWQGKIRNDFESAVFNEHPELQTIKTKLLHEGALYSSMSGSGSSLFGIYKIIPKNTFPEYFEWIGKL